MEKKKNPSQPFRTQPQEQEAYGLLPCTVGAALYVGGSNEAQWTYCRDAQGNAGFVPGWVFETWGKIEKMGGKQKGWKERMKKVEEVN